MESLHKETSVEPIWSADGTIDEVQYCKEFIRKNPLKCVNGTFFGIDGIMSDAEIKKLIYDEISPYWSSNLSKKVDQITNGLKLEAYEKEFPVCLNQIHVANGTLFLEKGFTEQKSFCRNRLPVTYNPQAKEPIRWIEFLNELLYGEDIAALQEFMGYLLIPTNKAQKMLVIQGKGGEGK